MDKVLFERLLHEDESNTLDFKRDQYPFSKATEEEKSELLKDILGFANAWRRTDAYILIGVEEVRGGRSKVLGVTEHLDDHSLQQFVHSRTNRPVRLAYEVFDVDSEHVGIIRIHQDDRPFYLEANYGKLRRHAVYVRRGSATDPQTPASPDEIARMSQQPGTGLNPQLVVVFTNPDRDEIIGATLPARGENCNMPAEDEIPELRPQRASASWDAFAPRTNSDYYARFAEYTRLQRMAFRARLVLMNRGSIEARKVLVEFSVPKGGSIELRNRIPSAPKRTSSLLHFLGRSRELDVVDTRTYPGDLSIIEDDDRYKMQIDFMDIQPGRRVRSDAFYVIVRNGGVHRLDGWVYAANLSDAEAVQLEVEADIAETSMAVNELVSLAADTGD